VPSLAQCTLYSAWWHDLSPYKRILNSSHSQLVTSHKSTHSQIVTALNFNYHMLSFCIICKSATYQTVPCITVQHNKICKVNSSLGAKNVWSAHHRKICVTSWLDTVQMHVSNDFTEVRKCYDSALEMKSYNWIPSMHCETACERIGLCASMLRILLLPVLAPTQFWVISCRSNIVPLVELSVFWLRLPVNLSQ